MKQVKILKSTVANTKPVKVGDVVELSDEDAKTLVNMKKAVIVENNEPTDTIHDEQSEAANMEETDQKKKKVKKGKQ